jgi:hypothetical protein
MSFSHWTVSIWRQSGCALDLDFSQEQDFSGRNLLQRGSRTPEELLSRAPFSQRKSGAVSAEFGVWRGLLQQSSTTTLEQFTLWKTGFFLHGWSSVMRLLCIKSCFSEDSPGLKDTWAHSFGHFFTKKREVARTFGLKCAEYLALLTARGTTSRFSYPALLSREV